MVSVTMDGSGRFGFVELRTEELAAEAMKLDKACLSLFVLQSSPSSLWLLPARKQTQRHTTRSSSRMPRQ